MSKHTIEVEITRKETETREVEFPLYVESERLTDYGSSTQTFYRYDEPRRCVSVSVRESPSIGERAFEVEVDSVPDRITASVLDGRCGEYIRPSTRERFDGALSEARKMLDEISGGG